jgi:hypothetical protein
VLAANGHLVTRRLWSSRDAVVDGLSVAMDRRGETTVAWVSHTRRAQATPGATGTARAAYGQLTGSWAPTRVVGRGSAEPRLAVASDREVLLSWVGHDVTVAWRAPGHRFGAPQKVGGLHPHPGPPAALRADRGDPGVRRARHRVPGRGMRGGRRQRKAAPQALRAYCGPGT